jgi:hypothetical protein
MTAGRPLCGHAICFASAAVCDERVEAFQHAHHLHRGPFALPARGRDVLRIKPVGLKAPHALAGFGPYRALCYASFSIRGVRSGQSQKEEA